MWTVSDARNIKSIPVILHIFSLQSGSCAGGHYSWRNQIQEGTSKHRSCAFLSFASFLRRRRNQLEYLRTEVYVTLLLPHPHIESGLAVRLDIHRTEDASVCQNVLNTFIPFYAAFLIMVSLSISSTIQLNTFVPNLETSLKLKLQGGPIHSRCSRDLCSRLRRLRSSIRVFIVLHHIGGDMTREAAPLWLLKHHHRYFRCVTQVT